MLSFAEFTEELISGCRVVLMEDPDRDVLIKIDKGAVNKPQRGTLTGLRFIKDGSRVAPTLYAEDLYSRYAQGCPIDRIAHEAVESIMQSFDIVLPFPEDDFDLATMTEDIRPRLISKERNPSIAQSVPHLDVGGGLMLIADIVRGEYRAMITNEVLEDADITKDELFAIAADNIPEGEAVMYGLSDVVCGHPDDRREMLADDGYKPDPEEFEVFILSNKEMFWGAAALFYPGIIYRLHDMIGDFYVIPSSVHELLILRVTADADPNNIAEMIWSANRSVVDEEEVLSDDLYICDSDKLRIAVRGGSGHKDKCEDESNAD